MNIAEAIAFSALILGLITGAGIWLDAYKSRLSNREHELELRAQIAAAGAGDPEFAKLEARMRVLERIATDRKARLANEIEDLRDQRSLVE